MNFQDDYILRMIEMMGDMMRKLGEMLDEREQAAELSKISEEYCGMPLTAALAVSDETLLSLTTPRARFIMSEILYVRAACAVRMDEDEKTALYARAMRLLCSLSGEPALARGRWTRLEDLTDLCEPSPGEWLACAAFYRAAERYDRMEDAAFHAAEGDGDLIPACKAMMASLLPLQEMALTLGGLPKEDVRAAVRDLAAMEGSA